MVVLTAFAERAGLSLGEVIGRPKPLPLLAGVSIEAMLGWVDGPGCCWVQILSPTSAAVELVVSIPCEKCGEKLVWVPYHRPRFS